MTETSDDHTRFEYQLLYTLADIGPVVGIEIKKELQEDFDYVNHGRLYQNLRGLVDGGLVLKSPIDGRSNEYELSRDGKRAVANDLAWRFERVNPGLEPGDLTAQCDVCDHEWDGYPTEQTPTCPNCLETDPQMIAELD